MGLSYKIFEDLSPLGLQNQVNAELLLGEESKRREVRIVSQSYFVRADGDMERHYLSVFYESSPKI